MAGTVVRWPVQTPRVRERGRVLRPYRIVLAVPGARIPAIASLFGRLPLAMLSLAIVALIQDATGSYAAAGLVVAAFSVGAGLGGPLQGRLVDRTGQTRVLVPATIGCAAFLLGLLWSAGAGAPVAVLPLLSGAAGLIFPQVGPCMRTLWASLIPGDPRLEPAFALDAVTLEAVFISGPALVGAALAVGGPRAPLLLAVAILLVGGLWYSATGAVRSWRGTGGRAVGLGPMRAPGVRVLIAALLVTSVVYGVWNVAFSAFTVGRGQPELLGVLFAAAAGGSLLGGLWYGSRVWPAPAPRRFLLLLGLFALSTVPLGFARTVPQLAALLFVAGLWIAPSKTVAARLIDVLAPPGTATEAYTLMPTADALGVAVGAWVAGIVIDGAGVEAALSSSCIGIALGTLLIAVRLRTLEPLEAPISG
jgi:predicted MFS family arabinose efflux permease